MKDILRDLVQATSSLNLTHMRVETLEDKTHFRSMNDTLEFNGFSKKPIKEFKNVFGMTNLNVLRGYVDIFSSYENENVSIDVVHRERNGNEIPYEFVFKGKGLSTAHYRLSIEPSLRTRKEIPNWTLSVDKIEKRRIEDFGKFSTVLSNQDKKFSVSTVDGNLVFHIGDQNGASNHVDLIMATNVEETLKKGLTFPIPEVLSILKQYPQSSIRFHEKGICEIKTDTGLMNYEFFFLGSKT